MNGRPMWIYAEGDLAGVLVLGWRARRWRVLARFHGPGAEERARQLVDALSRGSAR
jgi:hypothetical protein